jgi:hypothetical protein
MGPGKVRSNIGITASSVELEGPGYVDLFHWVQALDAPPPIKKEATDEHDHDKRRYEDLLLGLGQRTARGLQPWLAAVVGKS